MAKASAQSGSTATKGSANKARIAAITASRWASGWTEAAIRASANNCPNRIDATGIRIPCAAMKLIHPGTTVIRPSASSKAATAQRVIPRRSFL